MFERFTDRARRVLVLAQEEARLLGHGFIGTEHLLLGLIEEQHGVAARVLESLEISADVVRENVAALVPPLRGEPLRSPPFTPRAKKVLELAFREALQLGHDHIGTEHLLLGLAREGEGVAAQVLTGLGADLARVRQAVMAELVGYGGAAEPGVATTGAGAAEGEAGARLVVCSFCGRRPPASGRLVSGRDGTYICERCVVEWSLRLREQRDDDAEAGSDQNDAGGTAEHTGTDDTGAPD